ncbi:RNA polymerase III RPC4-domain-containing protein [Whalleya microplaca]|nr:RNA polymerase III RPC4-domain-containing protein [Whalleya microplaca]
MPPRGSRGGTGRGRGARGAQSASISRATFEEATPSVASGSDSAVQDAPLPNAPAQPSVQAERPTAGSSRQSQTPAAPARIGGRFRPKNVRRDAAERARLEEQRNRDLAIKIKAEEREQRAEERRSRRGRGRGDMTRGGLHRRTVTASGPFSAIPSENVKAGSGGWGWSGGGGGGSGGGGFGSKAGYDYNSTRYQPRRENESRVNVELLNGFTGFGDDGSPLYQPSRYGQKSTGSLPVGLLRMQHEEAEVKVKTTAELEAEERQSSDEGELFVEDSPVREPRDVGLNNDDTEVWHAAPKGQVKVKTEPGTEPESMDVDMSDIPEAAQPKAPPSPELKRKPIVTEDGTAVERTKKRKDKMSKDPEIVHNAIDLEALLRELSFSTPAAREEGQEAEQGEQQEPQGQEKDNLMYLFQLPPILPPLSKPTDEAGIDLTSQDNSNGASAKVKVEEGTEAPRNAFSGLPPEGGCIGKMNVRKSGKVEFDWGGTTLNLGMGTETEFLTSAIMLEQNENLENPELSTGFACGMGQVMGKFVLTPIWDEEEDWDPSLDDIDGL